ncbi:hypothetical protein F909_00250 [Acinetobacter sp. ANC 3929]|uniref:hypothetical protein n=1 Tax=Acinetobacter sp. ANC 3929 TaxID=1217707 RepID=UPI0002CE183E|nr:hypothetical protein [Acinetobacter sp. ANC 3929]ENW84343.1 hypothetical protein F909_00250 [Acinetobacter sp. ANC 3929]
MDKTKIEINNITIQHAKKIILAHSKKGERYILDNIQGYLSAHWEHTPTHQQIIARVWDLELIKSNLINQGAYIDWENYQYVLNHFAELNKDNRSISQILSQGMKQVVTSWTDAFQALADALKKFGI